jgi:hypothetical protein
MNRNIIFGALAGIFILAGIGLFTYNNLQELPEAASTVSDSSLNTENITPSSTPDSSPTPSLTTWATTKPTPKPTIKPSPSPTPTPKPLRDYYVQSHSQILIPEQTNATEYVETQTVSRQRLEVDFAASNVSVGDTVVLRIYEDGNVKKEETRTVASTSNFHFAEVYYPMQWTPGTHTVKMVFNENQAFPESNFSNNEHTFSYKIIAETTPPTFSIRGPELINGQTCLTVENLSDNKSVYTDVWAKWKIDGGEWSPARSGTDWGCITGTSGSSHTFYAHAEDARGNVKEDSKVFTLY